MNGADINAMIRPVPRTATLRDDADIVWGASMTRTDDGICHLLYARWRPERNPSGWLKDSVIGHATADHPLGPYKQRSIVLPPGGGGRWDAVMTHNPTVHRFGDKYYLYHIGTRFTEDFDDCGEGAAGSKLTRDVRCLRMNQRIGVAVADHPAGPWTRFDEPLIDVKQGTIRHFFVANPAITQRPDGTFLMVYKCMGADTRVLHGVATADTPLGPFTSRDKPVFAYEGEAFPAEDPTIWVQDDRYYAILKDFRGVFTGEKSSLALFTSEDGFDWKLTDKPLVSGSRVTWDDGETQELHRMERPQLWLKDGKPAILFCAAATETQLERSFNVHIPLTDDL